MESILFKPVSGFLSYYEISNTGLIRSLKRTIVVSGKIRNLNERFLTPKINNDGYAHVQLSKNGNSTTYAIHRLVAEHFLEMPIEKQFVNHINGNKLDNNVNNLEWVTRSENMIHAYNLGLCSKRNRRKRVIDNCTGVKYDSIKEAATFCNIKYHTLIKYLNGKRVNKSCLQLNDLNPIEK